MVKKRTIRKEKTLIEGLVEDSKELISINNAIQIACELIFRIARCKFNPIDSKQESTKSTIFELETQRHNLEVHMANMMKAAYSHQYEIKFDTFHLSSGEMQAGHAYLTVHKHNEVKRAILFLSDVNSDFLEPIKAGEIRIYNEELEKHYLSNCAPVWTPDAITTIYLESLKARIK